MKNGEWRFERCQKLITTLPSTFLWDSQLCSLLFALKKNVAWMMSFKQEMRFYRLPLLWDLENEIVMCSNPNKSKQSFWFAFAAFIRMPKTIFSRQNETFLCPFFLLYLSRKLPFSKDLLNNKDVIRIQNSKFLRDFSFHQNCQNASKNRGISINSHPSPVK